MSLAVVALLCSITLIGWIVPLAGRILPQGWQMMTAGSALAALLSAVSLELAEKRHSRRMNRVSPLVAAAVVLQAGAILVLYSIHFWPGMPQWLGFPVGQQPSIWDPMAPQTALGFVLLGASMALISARGRIAAVAADILALLTFLLVLVLVSGYVFGAIRMFSFSPGITTSPQTLVCFVVLTAVALTRRAEHGVLAVFLGRGIAGTIARALAPLLIVLPFLREISRARLVAANVIPAHYVTALLASVATMLSLVLLLFLAWRIDAMETEIRDLSLRDELTGLYNLKGFTVLGDQALRLARRSQLPFSVLFIDLDDLKAVNDALGHSAGSSFLVETGELLLSTFRETDVLARIGGDEFVVAGQFSQVAVSIATERLQAAVAARNLRRGGEIRLGLSIGHVSSSANGNDSLNDMLMRADRAMYVEKRQKKLLSR